MNSKNWYKTIQAFTFVFLLAPLISTAQTACDAGAIQTATGSFEIGRFDHVFSVLAPCLPDRFGKKDQRIYAYRLMALSYIARDSLEQARQSISLLLREDSRYRADPALDPHLFVDLVDELRPSWYTWLWRGNQWKRWVGRGVIVAGAVSVPWLLKKDTQPDLPGFPPFPQ